MTDHLLSTAVEACLLCTTPGTENDNGFCEGEDLVGDPVGRAV
jgi:hypothetical protein